MEVGSKDNYVSFPQELDNTASTDSPDLSPTGSTNVSTASTCRLKTLPQLRAVISQKNSFP